MLKIGYMWIVVPMTIQNETYFKRNFRFVFQQILTCILKSFYSVFCVPISLLERRTVTVPLLVIIK